MAKQKKENESLSYDTKTIIVVLTLILVYPVGLILMFLWMKWPKWVKIIISLPVLLFVLIFLGAFAIGLLSVINPRGAIEKANCMNACLKQNYTQSVCVEKCGTQGFNK